MYKRKDNTLYEQISHKSFDLPMKIYKTNNIYLHWHNEYEFIMVEKGNILLTVNGEQIQLTENKLFLLQSGDLHSTFSQNNQLVTALVVSPSFWTDDSTISLFSDKIKFQSLFDSNDKIGRSIITLFKQIVDIYNQKPFAYTFLLKAKFLELFSTLISNGLFTHTRKNDRQIPSELKNLINYVHQHYTEKITLKTLSTISFYSQTYVIRLFKKYTNLTPAEYILQYRLEIAKEKLLNTKSNNVNIALNCGFNSENYFIRAFKNHYGVTPSVYRKLHVLK